MRLTFDDGAGQEPRAALARLPDHGLELGDRDPVPAVALVVDVVDDATD